MKTTINAKPAEWSPAIQSKWESFEKFEGTVTHANWYTARPYAHEYSTGSEHEGFVYTIGYKVYQKEWRAGKPDKAYTEPRS